MPSTKKTIGWLLALGVVGIVTGGIVTGFRVSHEKQVTSDEQKLARTLGILRTSTAAQPKTLKVLFYGQSITKSGWDKLVQKHWHERYPNTVFLVQNRAIGGFPTQDLERTTREDIAEFYPDLIVFHDYGDHHAYERILRMFRSLTAADVILQTDHGDGMPGPICREGLQFSLHRPAGCAGFGWLHQRDWHDEMSYHKIPTFARTYGLAVEPQRQWWRDYLLRTGTSPEALLADEVHPNEQGKELMAAFFNQYFDSLVDAWHGESESAVQDVAATPSVTFDGTRLELIASHAVAAIPTAMIDGKPANSFDGCWVAGRATELNTGRDWPVVRQIDLLHDHIAETWTATLSHFSADDAGFDFQLSGSVSGPQGSGNAKQNFVTPSGTVRIAAQDWMPARAFQETKIKLADPFVATWTVKSLCGAAPEVSALGTGESEYRYVLAAGLPPGEHHAMIAGADSGTIRIYRPALKPR